VYVAYSIRFLLVVKKLLGSECDVKIFEFSDSDSPARSIFLANLAGNVNSVRATGPDQRNFGSAKVVWSSTWYTGLSLKNSKARVAAKVRTFMIGSIFNNSESTSMITLCGLEVSIYGTVENLMLECLGGSKSKELFCASFGGGEPPLLRLDFRKIELFMLT